MSLLQGLACISSYQPTYKDLKLEEDILSEYGESNSYQPTYKDLKLEPGSKGTTPAVATWLLAYL